MTSSFVLSNLLLIVASSQCIWDVINPDGGQLVTLDLTPLYGVTMDLIDTESSPHHYLYTPCQNNETCKGDYVMVEQTVPNDPGVCYILGRWDKNIQPYYSSIDGGTWTFKYDNGDNDCGNPARTWSPRYICAPGVKYQTGYVTEIPSSCFYEVEIRTEFACQNWTTTTTSIPGGECLWNIGNNILNLTAFKNQTLATIDTKDSSIVVAMTPCGNLLTCDNKQVMAYRQQYLANQCINYLAIWDEGLNQPNYSPSERTWQFVYTNGEKCNGFENIFAVYWECDYQTRNKANIVSFDQTGACSFEMHINSSYACS